MFTSSVHLDQMRDLFEHEIQDLYSAENQILEALPLMIKATKSSLLKQGLEKHLEETKEHVARLEKIGEELDLEVDGATCKGMEGLIEEGSEMMKADGSDEVRDAAIIIAAQRVEHYEISGYGSARQHALELGYKTAAQLLEKTLKEEFATDEKLSKIAESRVNPKAENV